MDFKTFLDNCKKVLLDTKEEPAHLSKKAVVDYCICTLNANSLWVNFERTTVPGPVRVILTTSTKPARYTKPFAVRCNGTIIAVDKENIKVIASPPPYVKSIAMGYFAENKFTATKMIDGTMLTAYYWKDSWRWSTARAYDIEGYLWRGTSVLECLKETIDVPAVTAKMNKSRSYTIILSHPMLHPFQNKPSAKFVCSCDGSSNYDYEEDVGVEMREPIELGLQDMIENCANAKDNIEQACMGYTLHFTTGKYAGINYNYDSTLFNLIRKLIYKIPGEDMHAYRRERNNAAEFDYVILRAFLRHNADEFKAVFPRLEAEMDTIANLFGEFYVLLKNKCVADPPAEEWKQNLVKHVHEEFVVENGHINVTKKEMDNILFDFMISERFIDYYYATLKEHGTFGNVKVPTMEMVKN